MLAKVQRARETVEAEEWFISLWKIRKVKIDYTDYARK